MIPFELVQKTYLKAETDALKALENSLAEIPGEYEALLEELTEEDKETFKECFSEEGDAFVLKEVSKKLKELKKDDAEDSRRVRKIFSEAENTGKQEKKLRDAIKTGRAELELRTKEKIEALTEEEVLELLELKWIAPLTEKLSCLPDSIVDELVRKIQKLQSKYETTFFDLENEIRETEKELAKMMDDLDGSEYDLKGLREFKSLLLGE